MPDENIPTDAPTTDTTSPEGTQTAPAEPAWDYERGMNTIKNLREIERAGKSTIQTLRGAVAAMAAGRPDLPEGLVAAMGTPASAAPTGEVAAYSAAFGEIANALGVSYDNADTKPILDAARASRLSAEAGKAIAKRGLDDRLTRAVLDLSSVDLAAGADAIRTQVEEAVSRAAFESPNLRVRTQTATVSGAEFGPGSGQSGMRSMVDRESLKYMSPTEIQQAARSGLIDGVGTGK